ncbi:MAG: PEP-CTERM sorting domain-containing protein [Lentisphaeraceae bacterium]|nr:PEP-CTERM sorting domain-containing protein [Lentisphaeraceae bacterium]
MKRVLFAVVALLGTLSLEAVTVTWSQLATGTGNKSVSLGDGFKATESQVVTYAILVPQGVPTGSAFLMGVSGVNDQGSAQGNWNQAYLKASADGTLSFTYKPNVDGENVKPTSVDLKGAKLSTDKASLLALTVDRGGKSLTVYKDGEQLATTGTLASLFNKDKDMVMLAYGQNFGGNEAFALDYEVYAYAGAITAADATIAAVTVPEPTVWALVAMGVAGMALRRKRA